VLGGWTVKDRGTFAAFSHIVYQTLFWTGFLGISWAALIGCIGQPRLHREAAFPQISEVHLPNRLKYVRYLILQLHYTWSLGRFWNTCRILSCVFPTMLPANLKYLSAVQQFHSSSKVKNQPSYWAFFFFAPESKPSYVQCSGIPISYHETISTKSPS
jgi:hypothetical protein